MSEIFISGVEIPKDKDTFILIASDGSIRKLIVKEGAFPINTIIDGAKAVELPPHGDLKDVDEIIAEFESWYCDENRHDFIHELELAPTWISASKKEINK